MSTSLDIRITDKFKIAIALTAVTLVAEVVGLLRAWSLTYQCRRQHS